MDQDALNQDVMEWHEVGSAEVDQGTKSRSDQDEERAR